MGIRWNHWFTLSLLGGLLVLAGLVLEILGYNEVGLVISLSGLWVSLIFSLLGLSLAAGKEHEQMTNLLRENTDLLKEHSKEHREMIFLLKEIRDLLRR